jgi:hypothetical protein
MAAREKVALIRSVNPTWADLSEYWCDGKAGIQVYPESLITGGTNNGGERRVLRAAQDDKLQ